MTQAAPPRHLLRRLLGYAIDMAAAWLVVAVLFAATGYSSLGAYFDTAPAETSYRLSSEFNLGTFALPLSLQSNHCGLASQALTDIIALPAGASFDGPVKVCVSSQFGIPTALRLTWVEDSSGEKQPTKLDLSFITPPLNLAGLLCVLTLIITSALSSHFLHTTLGKRLMGLKFAALAPPQPLRREIIKNLPNLIVTAPLLPFYLGWLALPQTNAFAIILALLHAAAILALWLAPLRRKGLPFDWSDSAEIIRTRPPHA